MQTYIEIILLEYIFSLILTREFCVLCAHGWAGQTQLPYWRRISQSEIQNSAAAESEGGQKFLPRLKDTLCLFNPLPFCPPERKSFYSCHVKRGNQNSQSGFSSKKVRISSSKHHQTKLVRN